MNKFSDKQKYLLIQIGNEKNQSIGKLAKGIFCTSRTYKVKDMFVQQNLIRIDIINKAKQIPHLTRRGKILNEKFKEELLHGSRFC